MVWVCVIIIAAQNKFEQDGIDALSYGNWKYLRVLPFYKRTKPHNYWDLHIGPMEVLSLFTAQSSKIRIDVWMIENTNIQNTIKKMTSLKDNR